MQLEGKIALITGASRGIGEAVAKRYAKEGVHVILVARSTEGLEKVDDAIRAEGGKATLVPLDIKEEGGIEHLGAVIAERFGRLDVLVGNAAILGGLTPLEHVQPKKWDDIMAVNVTANWRLIRSMGPLLRASQAGRALFVTSGIVGLNKPFWGPYAASKAALEEIVRIYAAEVKEAPVCVNMVDPGIVATSMRAEAMPGEDPASLPVPESVTDLFVTLASNDCTNRGECFKVSDQAVQPTVCNAV